MASVRFILNVLYVIFHCSISFNSLLTHFIAILGSKSFPSSEVYLRMASILQVSYSLINTIFRVLVDLNFDFSCEDKFLKNSVCLGRREVGWKE